MVWFLWVKICTLIICSLRLCQNTWGWFTTHILFSDYNLERDLTFETQFQSGRRCQFLTTLSKIGGLAVMNFVTSGQAGKAREFTNNGQALSSWNIPEQPLILDLLNLLSCTKWPIEFGLIVHLMLSFQCGGGECHDSWFFTSFRAFSLTWTKTDWRWLQ